jgi:hypothetical protein
MVKAKSFPPPLLLGKTARWARAGVESWLVEQLRPQLEWKPPSRARRSAAPASKV